MRTCASSRGPAHEGIHRTTGDGIFEKRPKHFGTNMLKAKWGKFILFVADVVRLIPDSATNLRSPGRVLHRPARMPVGGR